ncbi:glycosyltransferase 87 family protein [Solwaraspora sp. WMMD406]|uniref:glycosyltransferase 87 family protein n=1 Tax=Solwaraspora sp. WMMD406 TaxID=3016095 RepID=UPI002417E0D8|nr:glycosyltransferase 87 family protein [Solwaraspora sp. WMMD406]MDG4767113.1 glycosyltransferase 87 family protein [Solwaraspora sp. WMMD406]
MTGQRTDKGAGMPQRAAGRTGRQVAVLVGLAVVVAGFLAVAAERHGFFDLKVYYGAMWHWVRADGELYDHMKPFSQYGFTYPPFAALTMAPMAFLPWHGAIVVSVTLAVLTSALVLWWLVDPVARREGWTRWFAFGVAACLVAAYEPMRETVNFGQVNTVLLVLVAADLLWLVAARSPVPARWKRFAGVGVGLATAIKLTPGIFIVYLLVTRRFRAAVTAAATAAVATLFAAAVAPDASREFWTQALWNTDRVGSLDFVSNQSLRGVVARLDPLHPSTVAWLLLVLAVLAWWAWRARAAVATGDETTGLALTAVVGCLVSPVTWVHHLVWLIPGLILLVDSGLAAASGSRRRRLLLGFATVGYLVLISRLVWLWRNSDASGPLGFLGANAYVWVSLALLLALPVRRLPGAGRWPLAARSARLGSAGLGDEPATVEPGLVPQLGEVDRSLSR